ncbi:hypothetical protein HELRODRAFT_152187, partial [Helobdella robusta]|uniref:CTCK domain-containing protein n=1 Tax=Helobdella robusta TaxID=6412 RepID=T1EKQ0_HELRO
KFMKTPQCKSIPMTMTIRKSGCHDVNLKVKYCGGMCQSYYIPIPPVSRKDRRDKKVERLAHKICSFCKPKSYKYRNVEFTCPNSRYGPKVQKKVRVIDRCACTNLPL